MSNVIGTTSSYLAIGVAGMWSFMLLQTAPTNTMTVNAVASAIPPILGFLAGTYLETRNKKRGESVNYDK